MCTFAYLYVCVFAYVGERLREVLMNVKKELRATVYLLFVNEIMHLQLRVRMV